MRQLTEEFEAIGARKGGEAGMEFARYSAQIVGNRFDRALELMADVVLHPTFPAEEFDADARVQLQEIRRRDDEPMRRIFDLVRERFYAGTTAGSPRAGPARDGRGADARRPAHVLAGALSSRRAR